MHNGTCNRGSKRALNSRGALITQKPAHKAIERIFPSPFLLRVESTVRIGTRIIRLVPRARRYADVSCAKINAAKAPNKLNADINARALQRENLLHNAPIRDNAAIIREYGAGGILALNSEINQVALSKISRGVLRQ
jgi:hypothetical protein